MLFFSHDVEDRIGARAREVTDPLRLLPIGANLVISAPGHGELQGFLAGIHGDDRSRGHGLEALDADVAQPADPHDNGERPRAQIGDGLPDRVISGQAGVGQRGDLGRRGTRGELDDRPRAGLEQLGHAAGAHQAGQAWPPRAPHVVSHPARAAHAAGEVRVTDDGVTDG